MSTELDFYDEGALLDRLSTGIQESASQAVFVVGSALTAPPAVGKPGVPGVAGVIDLIRASFNGNERDKLESDLASCSNAYQQAFRFLLGRRGPRAANGIIKTAVAAARRPMPAVDDRPPYSITAATDDAACRGYDNDASGWYLTPAVDGLGRLATMPSSPFGRMIVTTNFDPLISAAISVHGGNSYRSFLYRDGSLNQTDGPGTHVVHLHGYWYGSDTLHTPQQLLQPRPQLKASLAQLLRANVFVVLAYGGWDDAFTQAMMNVVLEDSSFPEIIWCFYDQNPRLSPEFEQQLLPGLARGRVTLYAGIDVHRFLPKLADAWQAPTNRETLLDHLNKPEMPVHQPTESKSSTLPARETYRYDPQLLDALIALDSPPVVEFLVGRDDDLALLLTSAFKVGFVTGFGGQGKSALTATLFAHPEIAESFAVRIWRDCRETSARFEDQIAAIIEALGGGKVLASELAKQSMEDLAELLVQLTEQEPVLLIFDNVDHYVDLERRTLIGAAGRFIDRLLTLETKSRLILTCRPPIRGGIEGMLSHHLQGLDLPASIDLFKLRRAEASNESIGRAHDATKGHAFWLDLLAAQVAKRSPDVQLEELLQSISEGTGEIPDATLRSIWNSLRPREQVTLQALAEALRPTTLLELADYVRAEINYKNASKAINLLRDLNLVVLKSRRDATDAFELHPLIRAFIQKTFPRTERVPFILAILSSYLAWLAPHIPQFAKRAAPEAVHRCLEAAELCINADRMSEALDHLEMARRAVTRQEPPGEFVRIAKRLFTIADLKSVQSNPKFEGVYDVFVRLLANLGQTEAATEALARYEKTLEGKDSRYIHLCDMQCYLHWVNGDFSIAIKWGSEGEKLRSSGVDTPYSTAHNLALAQRDSGAIDPALKQFLQGLPLEDAADPAKLDVDLGGAFYGNVGRCLHLMGQAEPAIACYRKSARLIEEEHEDVHLENQAYIRQWIGELLEARDDKAFARACIEASIAKWRVVSPPKASRLRTACERLFDEQTSTIDPYVAECRFLDWVET